MNGCKYCRMEANGDTPRDRKDCINHVILKPVNGVAIKLRGMIMGNELVIDTNNDMFFFGTTIKYCPMCGRKLEAFTDD